MSSVGHVSAKALSTSSFGRSRQHPIYDIVKYWNFAGQQGTVIRIEKTPPTEGVWSALLHSCLSQTLTDLKELQAPSVGGGCVIPVTTPYSSDQQHAHCMNAIRVRNGLTMFLLSWTQARAKSYRPYSKASAICLVNSIRHSDLAKSEKRLTKYYHDGPTKCIENWQKSNSLQYK